MLTTESAFPHPNRSSFNNSHAYIMDNSSNVNNNNDSTTTSNNQATNYHQNNKFYSMIQSERDELLYIPLNMTESSSSSSSQPLSSATSNIQSFTRLYTSLNTAKNSIIPVNLKPLTVCIRKRPLNYEEYHKTKQFDILTCVPDHESKFRIQQYYSHAQSTPSAPQIEPLTTSTSHNIVLHEPRTKYDLSQMIINHSFTFDRCFNEYQETNQVYDSLLSPIISKLQENLTSLSHILTTLLPIQQHQQYHQQSMHTSSIHNLSAIASTFTSALHGHGTQATIFAYGQTGSGKTHTMTGLTNRIIHDLHTIINLPILKNLNLVLCLSSFELYCSRIYDLLCDRQPLVLREDGQGNMQVIGLTEYSTRDINVIQELLLKSNNCRSIGTTKVNADSSRSHSVLQLFIRDGNYGKLLAKISLVDLAGSEKAHESAPPDAQTALEAAEINKSLLALKECIRAMGRGQFYQRKLEKEKEKKQNKGTKVPTKSSIVRHSMDSQVLQRLTQSTASIYMNNSAIPRRNSFSNIPQEDIVDEDNEIYNDDEETSIYSNDENDSIIDVDARIQAARFSNYHVPNQHTKKKTSQSIGPSHHHYRKSTKNTKIPHTHIPFRGSKLTQILRDCFTSPGAITIMIATLSPGNIAADHTLNTLRYADRLKEIGKHNHSQDDKVSSNGSAANSNGEHTNLLKTTILADNPAGKRIGVLGNVPNKELSSNHNNTKDTIKENMNIPNAVVPPPVPTKTSSSTLHLPKQSAGQSAQQQFTAKSVVTLDKERRKKNAALVSARASELVGNTNTNNNNMSRMSLSNSTSNNNNHNNRSKSLATKGTNNNKQSNAIPPPPPPPGFHANDTKLTVSALHTSEIQPQNKSSIRSPTRPPPPVPGGTETTKSNDQSQLVALLDAQIQELTNLRNRMNTSTINNTGTNGTSMLSPNTQEKKVQQALSTALQIQQQQQQQQQTVVSSNSGKTNIQPINAKRNQTKSTSTSTAHKSNEPVNNNSSNTTVPTPVWSTLSSASVSTPQWIISSPHKKQAGKNTITVRVEDSTNAMQDFQASMNKATYISSISKEATDHPIIHVAKHEEKLQKQKQQEQEKILLNDYKNTNSISPVGAGPGSHGIYAMQNMNESMISTVTKSTPNKTKSGNHSNNNTNVIINKPVPETSSVPLIHLQAEKNASLAASTNKTNSNNNHHQKVPNVPRSSILNASSSSSKTNTTAVKATQPSPYSQPVVQLYHKARRASSTSSGGSSNKSTNNNIVPNWMNTLQQVTSGKDKDNKTKAKELSLRDDNSDLPMSPPRQPLLSSTSKPTIVLNQRYTQQQPSSSSISLLSIQNQINQSDSEKVRRDRLFLGSSDTKDIDISALSPKSAAFVGSNRSNQLHSDNNTISSKLSILNYQPITNGTNNNIKPIMTNNNTNKPLHQDIVRASLNTDSKAIPIAVGNGQRSKFITTLSSQGATINVSALTNNDTSLHNTHQQKIIRPGGISRI